MSVHLFLTMASIKTTALAKPKNAPQIRRNSGDISPDCLRRRLMSLNAIMENPTAMASSTPRITSVVISYRSFAPYSRGFRQTTRYKSQTSVAANVPLFCFS